MKWIAALLIFTQLTGCATVLLKDPEPIAIDSRPGGASAVVQCGGTRDSTVTPGRVSLPRTADRCALSLSKDGFATRIIRLERGYNGAFWSNFGMASGLPSSFGAWFGGGSSGAIVALAAVGVAGVIGFVVDRRNGRAYRHFPDEINEALEPIR